MMDWFVWLLAYLVPGIGVFVWSIRKNELYDTHQKKRAAKILILFPHLCLFWPVALIAEINRQRKQSEQDDL